MSITTLGDSLIHYEVLGRGEPIVFIHGWLGSWRYWWPAMQSLSSRHRTFAFDLWGFGDSSKSTEKYSFDEYVEMLEQFIDKLGIIQPVVLVGHSLGAAVALRFAHKRPDLVNRVAAIALPIMGSDINERLVSSDSSDIVSRVVGSTYPELDHELRKTDIQAMNNAAKELSNLNFVDDIRTCPRPLLLMFGDQDLVVKRPTGDLPDSHNGLAYVSLDNCNHFPMLEQSVKFNRLVLDFTHADGDLQQIAPKELWQRRTR